MLLLIAIVLLRIEDNRSKDDGDIAAECCVFENTYDISTIDPGIWVQNPNGSTP